MAKVDKKRLNTVKESIRQGFSWAAREGPLCEERKYPQFTYFLQIFACRDEECKDLSHYVCIVRSLLVGYRRDLLEKEAGKWEWLRSALTCRNRAPAFGGPTQSLSLPLQRGKSQDQGWVTPAVTHTWTLDFFSRGDPTLRRTLANSARQFSDTQYQVPSH